MSDDVAQLRNKLIIQLLEPAIFVGESSAGVVGTFELYETVLPVLVAFPERSSAYPVYL